MRKIIIASHGDFSKGMLNSLTMLVGKLETAVETYSLYPGESPFDYVNDKKAEIDDNQGCEYVILTDLKGGSVHTAMTELSNYSNVKLFCGMNMNMLLSLTLSTPNDIDDIKAKELLLAAKDGIDYIPHETDIEDEDF